MFLENKTYVGADNAHLAILDTLRSSVDSSEQREIITSGTGDGGLYTLQGDLLTSLTALMQFPGAWGVMQLRAFSDPANGSPTNTRHRQLCFQFDGAGGIRVKYSARDGFVLGAPSEKRTPSAADEVTWLGGGTDAAPTYENLLPNAGARRLQGYASEVDDTFFFLTYPVGGGAADSLIFFDLPSEELRNSGGLLVEQDSAILYARSGANCCLEFDLSSQATAPMTFLRYGEVNQLWARVTAILGCVRDSVGTLVKVVPGGFSTSPSWPTPTTPEETPRYVRRAGLSGTLLAGEVGDSTTTDVKGYSSLLRWGGQRKASPELLDAFDPITGTFRAGERLAIGDLIFLWSGTALQV